jgi:hypothetical protein
VEVRCSEHTTAGDVQRPQAVDLWQHIAPGPTALISLHAMILPCMILSHAMILSSVKSWLEPSASDCRRALCFI